jgi:hypothetical protein
LTIKGKPQPISQHVAFMPGETRQNSIGATVKTATNDKDEPDPGQWMICSPSPNQKNGKDGKSGHIRAGDFEKKYGIKLSNNPDKMIHPMAVLLGPQFHHEER